MRLKYMRCDVLIEVKKGEGAGEEASVGWKTARCGRGGPGGRGERAERA